MRSVLGFACLLVAGLALVRADARFEHDDRKFGDAKHEFKRDYRRKHDKEVSANFVDKDSKLGKSREQGPPPINEYALMARYIVNQADWSPVSTISTQEPIKSHPFVNVISISDGPKNNGSGIPYMFLTPLDYTAKDVRVDSRSTLLMTLAQGDYCKSKNYDPMDPRCARVMLSGKIKAVKLNTTEHAFAKEAMFGRHPFLAHMPADHQFYFAKLKISYIALLDNFGGPKIISLQDYFHPPTNNVTAEFLRWYQSVRSLKFLDTEERLEGPEINQNFLPSVILT